MWGEGRITTCGGSSIITIYCFDVPPELFSVLRAGRFHYKPPYPVQKPNTSRERRKKEERERQKERGKKI
jgi:hypothetical protein